MFKRKFKVRVVHHSDNFYTIEYSNSIFINNWHYIYNWVDVSEQYDLASFIPILGSYYEMEEEAKKFKSYSDVLEYHKVQIEKEQHYYNRRKQYLRENRPYNYKRII